MSHPVHHSISSVNKWGGVVEDYLPLHNWFDDTKRSFPDQRHRAIKHHAEGIFWAEEKFGPYITNSNGRMVPTRLLGEQHVMEDLGWIPTLADWLKNLAQQGWMLKPGEGRKVLNRITQNKEDYALPTRVSEGDQEDRGYPHREQL